MLGLNYTLNQLIFYKNTESGWLTDIWITKSLPELSSGETCFLSPHQTQVQVNKNFIKMKNKKYFKKIQVRQKSVI